MAFLDAFRTFLETTPLYVKLQTELPMFAMGLYPEMLELECPTCRQTRPFRIPGPRGSGAGTGGPAPITSGVYGFQYQCTGCNAFSCSFWVEVDSNSKWARKVGQLPPWNIAVGAQMERHLGDAAEHYKRARICMSQAYGLAACAYLRRVLEDTIDPLLRLELEVQEAAGAATADLEQIAAAIKSRAFETKTEVAYRCAPRSIIVEGANPLKLIHDRLSIGVHRLSEAECMTVAASLATALEYVVSELNRQRDARAEFAKALRDVADKAPPART